MSDAKKPAQLPNGKYADGTYAGTKQADDLRLAIVKLLSITIALRDRGWACG